MKNLRLFGLLLTVSFFVISCQKNEFEKSNDEASVTKQIEKLKQVGIPVAKNMKDMYLVM
jgi:hypothetical protein